MAKLIRLHRPDGTPVWVNLGSVVTLAKDDQHYEATKLSFGSTSQVVRGNPEDVVNKLTADHD